MGPASSALPSTPHQISILYVFEQRHRQYVQLRLLRWRWRWSSRRLSTAAKLQSTSTTPISSPTQLQPASRPVPSSAEYSTPPPQHQGYGAPPPSHSPYPQQQPGQLYQPQPQYGDNRQQIQPGAPGEQIGPNGERGFGATLIGSAGGGFLAHQVGGGVLGTMVGGIVGAIGANALEGKKKKKEEGQEAQTLVLRLWRKQLWWQQLWRKCCRWIISSGAWPSWTSLAIQKSRRWIEFFVQFER